LWEVSLSAIHEKWYKKITQKGDDRPFLVPPTGANSPPFGQIKITSRIAAHMKQTT
jgi:hypothetical protein